MTIAVKKESDSVRQRTDVRVPWPGRGAVAADAQHVWRLKQSGADDGHAIWELPDDAAVAADGHAIRELHDDVAARLADAHAEQPSLSAEE